MPVLSHQTQKVDEDLLLVASLLLRLTCSSERGLFASNLQDGMVVKVSDHPQNIRFSDGLEEGAATIHFVVALPLKVTGVVQLLRF